MARDAIVDVLHAELRVNSMDWVNRSRWVKQNVTKLEQVKIPTNASENGTNATNDTNDTNDTNASDSEEKANSSRRSLDGEEEKEEEKKEEKKEEKPKEEKKEEASSWTSWFG